MLVEAVSWESQRLRIIDQTKLPEEFCYVYCDSPNEVWDAIKVLKVRGAPAIGVAAAFGVLLGLREQEFSDGPAVAAKVDEVANYLATSRPTAVNLFWALDRMKSVARENAGCKPAEVLAHLESEAIRILEEDKKVCTEIGRNGSELLHDGDTVLTHCNAGALATAGRGTALALIYAAQEQGKRISVYADETRPLLQGARLTAWELMQSGVDVTLICDNTAAQVMKEGKIDLVIVGADRIAANGDAANKIGTYGVALLARAHNVPFYVAAPVSTFDTSIPSGDQIPIEERDTTEVTEGFGRRTAPAGVNVYSPAFDVTPAELITGIVTEKGILREPFETAIQAIFE